MKRMNRMVCNMVTYFKWMGRKIICEKKIFQLRLKKERNHVGSQRLCVQAEGTIWARAQRVKKTLMHLRKASVSWQCSQRPDQRGQSLEAMLSVVCTRRAWETI